MFPYEHPDYIREIEQIAALPLPWEKLRASRFLITGACGMIGSYMVDVLMAANHAHDLEMTILPMGRSVEKAKKRFARYWGKKGFVFIAGDVNQSLPTELGTVEYIFHAASNTHPVAYATDPIGTVCTNILGTNNLLNYATNHGCKRFIFASTVEVYGENRGDCERFTEDYCGYIDCNTLRAGYPESKRAGESLCQAYMKQAGVNIVIPRLPRVYGPTLLESDTKALSQFIRKALVGEDIVLKSTGTQFFSYIYVGDAVYGVLYTLFHGENGQAYNIADEGSDITLRDLAQTIAEMVGRKVIFDLPSATEQAGFSKATKAVMDSSKLRALGWRPCTNLKQGLMQTLTTLKTGCTKATEENK